MPIVFLALNGEKLLRSLVDGLTLLSIFTPMKSNSLFSLLMVFALPAIARSAELTGKVSSANGRPFLTNAIVYVVSGIAPGAVLGKREPSKLLIRGGQLDPQVLVVLTGETFTVKTEDKNPYNVQLRFRESMELNVALGAIGKASEFPTAKTFKAGRPELFALVTDDLGSFHGYLCVLEHPFYGLTLKGVLLRSAPG